jgi:glycerol-3-phosphate dehydrogenase (NAD(P)+)
MPKIEKIGTEKMKIVIIGAGVWGTALASLIERNRGSIAQERVIIWSRRNSESLETVVADADVIVSAVAMKGVREIIDRLSESLLPQYTIIVTATKGLDPTTSLTPSRLWGDRFPRNPIVVLSGPNLSKEIQKSLPAATVVASQQEAAARTVQQIFASEQFRVYVNNDPLGTELGGTLKNTIAIAAGVCDGMELGSNAKAALLTRALPEIIRIGTYLGAKGQTFFGLSGLGDLLATCDSPLSRNYQVGYRLARGLALTEIIANLEGTAEGINTTEVLMEMARSQNLAMPIVSEVYQLLQGKTTPQEAVKALMERELKPEFYEIRTAGLERPI